MRGNIMCAAPAPAPEDRAENDVILYIKLHKLEDLSDVEALFNIAMAIGQNAEADLLRREIIRRLNRAYKESLQGFDDGSGEYSLSLEDDSGDGEDGSDDSDDSDDSEPADDHPVQPS